jgi:hypothetical protein
VTTTTESPASDCTVACRVLVYGEDVYVLSHKSDRWYLVEDEEFAERCRELGGGAPLEAEIIVRAVTTTDHSTGGFNYLPHSARDTTYSIPLIVVGHERESFQVTGSGVGQQLLDQAFEEEAKC